MTGLGFIPDIPGSGLPTELAPPQTATLIPPPPLPPRRPPPQRPQFKAPPEPPDEFADLPPPVPPTAAELAAEAAEMVKIRAQQKLEMDHKMTNQSDLYDLLMSQQAATKAAQAIREAMGLDPEEEDASDVSEAGGPAKTPPPERVEPWWSSSDDSNPANLTSEEVAERARRHAARLQRDAARDRLVIAEEIRIIASKARRRAKREAKLKAAQEAQEKQGDNQKKTKTKTKTSAELAADLAKAAAERLAASAKTAEKAAAEALAAAAERRRQADLKAQQDRDLLSDDNGTDDDDPAVEGSPPPLSDEDRAHLAMIEREEGRAQAFADMIDSMSFTLEVNHALHSIICPYCQLNISALAYDEKKAHLLADLAAETEAEPFPRAEEMIHGPGALDLEYDNHAIRRWIYIDQRTHCQHCGIEFTEVGMRKIWFTGAERRAQIPDLSAASELQNNNHRIRCPYQRRQEGYNHLAQWGNANPLDGRDHRTLPRRSRADLNHLYAQMDEMGDDTYGLELIYNQVPRNLSMDAVRTAIAFPYTTELCDSQAQQYARAVRHVFCPSCRRRLRRRPYSIDGEERPAAEVMQTLSMSFPLCLGLPLSSSPLPSSIRLTLGAIPQRHLKSTGQSALESLYPQTS
ncbi:hypothetical protein DFP73DRAFT_245265 [Morchella snyderi]|nr:hypothetical protein DFP73DRAFT_245265 [Morchella snyderi]